MDGERDLSSVPADEELTPRQIAGELRRLPEADAAARFRLLPKDVATAVFDALDPWQQSRLIDGLRAPEVHALLTAMDPDDRVRLLDEMPAVVATRLLATLSGPERALTDLLLGYPARSAGRMMSPEYVELRPETTAAQALHAIRAHATARTSLHVLPVRGEHRRLEGVVALSELVRAAPDAPVSDLLRQDYPAVDARADQEDVARLMLEHDLVAVPVVDDEHRLIGIVTIDDAMDVLEQEQAEDLARSSGSEPLRAPYHAVSVVQLVRSRVVWLLFLVAAATLTVTVLGVFEGAIDQVVTLALFVPLLIGTGGNCGAQAATTMTRALAIGEVRPADALTTVLKEMRVGLLLGVLFAAIAFPAVTAIWNAPLGATVAITLLAICVWATTIGATLPLLSSRLGIDPAVVSAPLVTTLVDATGLLIYFGIAQALVL